MNSDVKNERTRTLFLCGAFVLFCGGLIFGVDIKRLLHFVLIINYAHLAQGYAFLFMLAVFWRFRKIRQYFLVLLLMSFMVLYPIAAMVHGKIAISVYLLALFLLWRRRKKEVDSFNWFVLSCVTIICLLSRYFYQIASPWLNFQIILICVYLFLPIFFACFFERFRKYSVILFFSVFFSIANIYTASVAMAMYSYDNHCGYYHDVYLSAMKGRDVLAQFAPKFHLLMWFKQNNYIKHPNLVCQKEYKRKGLKGVPLICSQQQKRQ